jgi:hypothetical protein
MADTKQKDVWDNRTAEKCASRRFPTSACLYVMCKWRKSSERCNATMRELTVDSSVARRPLSVLPAGIPETALEG